MSEQAIETGADVTIPDGEVTREQLVKIIEDGRTADSETAGESGEAGTPAEADAAAPSPAASEPAVDAKVAARILAATKAEKRATAEREASAKERAALATERAAIAEQAKAVEAFKSSKLSPSKALELLGMSPKEFLESLATEHEPAAIAKRESAGVQSEVERIKADFEQYKKQAEAEKHALRQQQHDAEYNEATQAFISHVDGAAEKYPHLIAEYTPAELAAAARAAAEQHAKPYFAKYGEYPDDDVIAEYLEDQARARAEALAERRARVGLTASRPSQGTPAIQGQPAKAITPRTLTNGASSQKATAAKPWTQKDADEESIRLIQQMQASQAT